jgi:hypothetical protein
VTVPWQQARDLAGTPTSPDGPRRADPVIVLTYGNAGAGHLQRLLQDQPELAATSGTGLLAACGQAALAWREAERRPEGALSSLAKASIRALASAMMTTITVRAGRPRWFEVAAAEPSAAETFLEVLPGTRFVCMHRACPDVIYATLQASPWGLAGQAYAAYTVSYPGSTIAALAAWWVGHAGSVLEFERKHPAACMRLRYEDLVADHVRTEQQIRDFLDLEEKVPSLPELPGQTRPALAKAEIPGCGAGLPTGQIPAGLLAQVNELHRQLGYPPLEARAAPPAPSAR